MLVTYERHLGLRRVSSRCGRTPIYVSLSSPNRAMPDKTGQNHSALQDRWFWFRIRVPKIVNFRSKSMVLVQDFGRQNNPIDRRHLARKTVLGCCLRIAIAILCGFRIAIPAKQGPGPPEIEILLKNTLLAFICGCLLSQTIVPS